MYTNSDYYRKNVQPIVKRICQDWIDKNGDEKEIYISDLDKETQQQLALCMYELSDRETEFNHLENCTDIQAAAVVMLKSNNNNDKQVFANHFIKGLIDAYKDKIQKMLSYELTEEQALYRSEL